MAMTGKTAAIFLTSSTTTLVFPRTLSTRHPARSDTSTAPAAVPELSSGETAPVPTWRRWAEAIATYASFAMLAFVLLAFWLTLMQGNAWI